MQLHEMRRYAAIHGSPFVPLKWEDPTGDFNNSLAKWVHAQPTLYSQRRLSIPQVGLNLVPELVFLQALRFFFFLLSFFFFRFSFFFFLGIQVGSPA